MSNTNDKHAAPMKSQKYGYLNKTYTVAITADLPMWMDSVSQGSTPEWRAIYKLLIPAGRMDLLQGQVPE